MVHRPMTRKWEMQIVADLRSGMPISDIRKKHGISWERLGKIQKEFGLQRHQGYHRIKKDEHAEFYDWFTKEWDTARKRIIGDGNEVQKDDTKGT